MKHDERDIDILARTLYGEAESGSVLDAEAIANVVLNRVKYPNWPNNIADVCLQPWQFSCWNQNDPNRDRIMKAKGGKWFQKCCQIAEDAAKGVLDDPTDQSTHYHTHAMGKPKWARKHEPVYNTPSHAFYNDIDTKPPQTAKQSLDQERPISSTRTAKSVAVAATATVAAPVIETMSQVAQAGSLVETIGDLAPWVLGLIALAAIGYILYARIDDRRKGLR